MSVDINKTLKTVDAYLSQVDSLLNKSYREGKEEKEELYNKVAYFILTAFPDGNERLTNLITSFPISVTNSNDREMEEEKQTYYVSYLKIMRQKLAAYKEELQVKSSPEKMTNELDEIKKEKREEATETTIQLNKEESIDTRRIELEERDKLNREILKIKKDVKDVKSILIGFSIGLAALIICAVLGFGV